MPFCTLTPRHCCITTAVVAIAPGQTPATPISRAPNPVAQGVTSTACPVGRSAPAGATTTPPQKPTGGKVVLGLPHRGTNLARLLHVTPEIFLLENQIGATKGRRRRDWRRRLQACSSSAMPRRNAVRGRRERALDGCRVRRRRRKSLWFLRVSASRRGGNGGEAARVLKDRGPHAGVGVKNIQPVATEKQRQQQQQRLTRLLAKRTRPPPTSYLERLSGMRETGIGTAIEAPSTTSGFIKEARRGTLSLSHYNLVVKSGSSNGCRGRAVTTQMTQRQTEAP